MPVGASEVLGRRKRKPKPKKKKKKKKKASKSKVEEPQEVVAADEESAVPLPRATHADFFSSIFMKNIEFHRAQH